MVWCCLTQSVVCSHLLHARVHSCPLVSLQIGIMAVQHILSSDLKPSELEVGVVTKDNPAFRRVVERRGGAVIVWRWGRGWCEDWFWEGVRGGVADWCGVKDQLMGGS